MGIDTQVRDPAPKEPIDLFIDPTYAGGGSDGMANDRCLADSSLSIPTTVNARLSPGQGSVSAGTRVFILSLEAGSATLWVTDPGPRCLGQVMGSEAQQIARVCQAAVRGLIGTVVSGVTGGRGDELRVQIHGA